MAVTITTFRKEIFELAAQALEGKDVSFTYKGKLLKVVPEERPGSKLDRLTPMEIFDSESVEPDPSPWLEIEPEWEKKWADRFDRLP